MAEEMGWVEGEPIPPSGPVAGSPGAALGSDPFETLDGDPDPFLDALELLGAEHAGFHDQIECLGELLETDFNGSGDALRALIEDLAVHESREERLVRELSADSPHPD